MRVRAMGLKIGYDSLNINSGEFRARQPEATLRKSDKLRAEIAKEGTLVSGQAKAEPELKAALKLIESKGYRLDDNTLQGLRDFMLNGEGDVEDKLEAIETALAKDMPLKEALLSRLQGFSKKSLLDFLPEGLKSPAEREGKAEDLRRAEAPYPSGPELRKAEKKSEHSVAKEGADLAGAGPMNSAGKGLRSSVFAKSSGLEAHKSKEGASAKDSGAVESPGKYAIEKVDELLRELLGVIEEEDGRSETLNFSSDKKGEELKNLDLPDAEGLKLLASYIAGSASINQQFSSGAVMMTKITPKLQALKKDFENLKKALAQDLYRLSSPDKAIKPEEGIRLLEKNIDRLDRAIMRSEMSLYMDLKGERELLKLSSRLQEARTLLQQGGAVAAREVLSNVLKALENLEYSPSIKKALLLYDTGLEAESAADMRDMKTLAAWLGDRAGRYQVGEGTASGLCSYLRKLGLGEEAENFENMSLQRQKALTETGDFVSLRGLLKELSERGAGPLDREAAQSMLGRIEALDLKNKILDTREVQTLSLELPLKLSGAIRNVKVFIQSPQHRRKLDWENFNMFFVLSTEKMGELGIKVEALQKNLSVSILNDRAKRLEENCDFKSAFKSEVEELGFRLVKMIMEEWRAGLASRAKAGQGEAEANSLGLHTGELLGTLEEGRFDIRL